MRRVEKMFLRKTEREEMDPKPGRAPLLSPGCDLFGSLPRRQPCQGSGRFGLFHLHYRCLCAAWLSPLSLPSKFRTSVQACNTSQGSWLREYKSRVYLVLPSGWPSIRRASGGRPTEGVRGLLRLDMH